MDWFLTVWTACNLVASATLLVMAVTDHSSGPHIQSCECGLVELPPADIQRSFWGPGGITHVHTRNKCEFLEA